MKALAILLPAALALAACGRGDGTNISITGDNGSAGIANGVATIDLPNLKGNLTLPKFQLDADQLDIDGVKLFPGSKVGGVSVFAGNDEKDDERVRIAFEAPASVTAVRDHFRSQFATAGYQVADDGQGLSGTTDDGKPLKLTLNAVGADRTKGELALGN